MGIPAKDLFLDEGAFGTSLLIAATDLFGQEVIEWEPETVELELRTLLKGLPAPVALDRFHAAAALLGSDLFFTSLTAFNAVCSTLAFDEPLDGEFYPASLRDIVWGLTEARLLLGPGTAFDEGFSQNIRLYVGKLLEGEGILNPPEIMGFAKLTRLDRPDTQAVADLPELAMVFEASQSETKRELEDYAVQRAYEMFDQIGKLELKTSDLTVFRKKAGQLLGKEIVHE